MEDEYRFWVRIWQTITAGVVALAAVIGGCVGHTDYRISEAIKAGADPIAANCALSSSGAGTSCVILATKKLAP